MFTYMITNNITIFHISEYHIIYLVYNNEFDNLDKWP